ncbi:hypothetical protein KCU83_g8028, partial [Aureobasidium melanogenum]
MGPENSATNNEPAAADDIPPAAAGENTDEFEGGGAAIVPSQIVVAGYTYVDWLTYPTNAATGPWRQGNTRRTARRGGAALLARALAYPDFPGCRVDGPPLAPQDDDPVSAVIDLFPLSREQSHDLDYVVKQRRYLRTQTKWFAPPINSQNSQCKLLVLEDTYHDQQGEELGLEVVRKCRPERLLFKMAPPLCDGRLWQLVRKGPFIDDTTQDRERLVVVVDADDLRAEGIELSRHLSWEKTCEDFVRQLGSNGRLDALVTCANLIVRFGCDGVIHHQGNSTALPKLYFDPDKAEGDFAQGCRGRMVGISTAYVAGVSWALASKPDQSIDFSIKLGMSVARRLGQACFQHNNEDDAPDYPLAEMMRGQEVEQKIATVCIPAARISNNKPWSILEDVIGDPAEIAHHLVKEGASKALSHAPLARFGLMKTADRQEMEGFRAITNLLQEYLAAPQTKPLSIGVFGPPGSGKSFGIVQVAMEVAKAQGQVQRKPIKKLKFNLAQFTAYSDLIASFQLIRDLTLSGTIPLVLFDEFDSSYGTDLGWLRYLLAPMQDGEFLENGRMHPLGASIFIFAGGTSSTFEEFAKLDPSIPEADRNHFTAAKGPDFVSRLRGYVNVRGPNPVPFNGVEASHDRMYPIRRAILLRALLKQREPLLKTGSRLRIDDAVLNGFLTVPRFHHGTRSLEAILHMSRVSGQHAFERAALPSEAQLNLHVNAHEFMERMRHQRLVPDELRNQLAKRLHDVYRAARKDMVGDNDTESSRQQDPALRDWGELSDDLKQSNFLLADDVKRKLRLIKCYVAAEIPDRTAVKELDQKEIESLAQREHERFNAERLQKHWRLGPKDTTKRTSPFLVPWNDLDEEWKEIDRALVRCLPSVLPALGYRVYRLGREGA